MFYSEIYNLFLMTKKMKRAYVDVRNWSSYYHRLPLEEILLRLPVESLLRFKCVCKEWRSLIENPTFISMHLINQFGNKDTDFLLVEIHTGYLTNCFKYCLRSGVDYASKTEFYAVPMQIRRELKFRDEGFMVDALNGLFCLCYNLFTSCRWDRLKICIWNPSTRKFKLLPPCPSVGRDNYTKNNSIQCLGFGFCSKSNDYKVVKISRTRINTVFATAPAVPFKVGVYSLSTNSWKTFIGKEKAVDQNISQISINSRFVNGASHWVVERKGTMSREDLLIWSYKFEEEVFQEIDLPKNFDGECISNPMIVEHRNSLAVISIENKGKFDMWVMKEYGVAESWIKLYTMEAIAVPLEIRDKRIIGCTSTNGELQLQLLSKNNRHRSLLYGVMVYQFHGISFKESLVSP